MKYLKNLFLFKKKSYFNDNASLYAVMWQKFLKKKLNIFFLGLLIFISSISILGYLITPDSSSFANRQHLEIALKRPGSVVDFIAVRKNEIVEKQNFFNVMFYGKKSEFNYFPISEYTFKEDKIEIELYTGMNPNEGPILELNIKDVVFALNSNWTEDAIVSKDLEGKEILISNEEIKKIIEKKHIKTSKFLLGTDRFGRDVLSQLIIGARVSLSVGFISVFISLVIGISLGSIAGYFGGRTDKFIMWIINVVWAIPTLFLVIAITFALGKGFWQIFFAVGLTLWVEIARLVRGLMISVKEKEFIEAARALGFSNFRIIVKHALPSTLGPIIVVSAANFASAILIESGLSFLGVGIQPPMPSWGTMLRDNYGFLIMDYSYLAIIPGIAIMILVLSFMIIGNGIRDSLDVKELAIKSK